MADLTVEVPSPKCRKSQRRT